MAAAIVADVRLSVSFLSLNRFSKQSELPNPTVNSNEETLQTPLAKGTSSWRFLIDINLSVPLSPLDSRQLIAPHPCESGVCLTSPPSDSVSGDCWSDFHHRFSFSGCSISQSNGELSE
ncbi:hypothetical protein L2E82_06116 [Cichorium intybus]|uniref:Uncharacterized protein n=1 Tax=Cichorium intybus TaxID=13427 RepID=A0ACB9H9L7_CICIN|nr:hypothetical protein L2E82_06116 [Cichorium intybus]